MSITQVPVVTIVFTLVVALMTGQTGIGLQTVHQVSLVNAKHRRTAFIVYRS